MQYYKYIIRNVARKHNKIRHIYAEAALCRQRLRHAHPHVALERWQTALCRERLRGIK